MSALLNSGEVSSLNQRQTLKYNKCCDAVEEQQERIRDLAEQIQQTKTRDTWFVVVLVYIEAP